MVATSTKNYIIVIIIITELLTVAFLTLEKNIPILFFPVTAVFINKIPTFDTDSESNLKKWLANVELDSLLVFVVDEMYRYYVSMDKRQCK